MDKAIKAGDLAKLKDLVEEAEKGTIDSSITKSWLLLALVCC
jgi:hypothetical protein